MRVIMFDWGGTLARVARQEGTRRDCVVAGLAFLRDAGIPVPDSAADDLQWRFPQAVAETRIGPDLAEFDSARFIEDWLYDNRLPRPDGRLFDELLYAFWRPWIGCLDVIPGVVEALRTLRQAGYGLGLVSNTATPEAVCRGELDREGLAPWLDFAVFSSTVGRRKPHELMYTRALGLAAARAPDLDPGEVLFVGDTPRADVDGPAGWGLRTALVRTGRWSGATSELEHQPDLVLDSVGQLPEVLAAGSAPRGVPRVS